jgi:hypothetical protein
MILTHNAKVTGLAPEKATEMAKAADGARSALTVGLDAEFDEAECLKYWPFDGDYGHPRDKILKDKIGIARKPGPCCECLTEIVPGERIRMIGAIFDDQMMSYRYCSACCAAMAKMWTDNWKQLLKLPIEKV